MFDKELGKFRQSVEKTIIDFFGKDFTVSKAVDWEMNFEDEYEKIYGSDFDKIPFSNINVNHQKDFAKHKTLIYFLNVLTKLNELENIIKGGN